ncbi:MAG: hypothetical protein WC319_09225 [Candidatus Paceibacterota bacterium]|jgi:hypothetical protein
MEKMGNVKRILDSLRLSPIEAVFTRGDITLKEYSDPLVGFKRFLCVKELRLKRYPNMKEGARKALENEVAELTEAIENAESYHLDVWGAIYPQIKKIPKNIATAVIVLPLNFEGEGMAYIDFTLKEATLCLRK